MSLNILVVDDEKDLTELVKELLGLEGHTVTTAYNGKLGLEAYLKIKPNLIITDQMMPVLDGLGMIRKIREEYKDNNVKIILSSAGVKHLGAEVQWDLFLRKPPNIDDYLKAIQKLFQHAGADQ
ncbi:response regulator [Peredibacter starrii]|uniref:Response regulator n=1 Tax=Peredibacter starrii TaxID=28202 RepID=A0AAX4HTI5_9BACT|nr:response regulator [Peredibacter starrii]WPU66500.1 response regulator [Peredibacter starrii]